MKMFSILALDFYMAVPKNEQLLGEKRTGAKFLIDISKTEERWVKVFQCQSPDKLLDISSELLLILILFIRVTFS